MRALGVHRSWGPRIARALGAVAGVGLALGLASISSTAAAAPQRWPSWPTEVDRVAAPLTATAKPPSDRERGLAVLRLQAYPTELIVDALLVALEDPSIQVRREALRVCYIRRIDPCVLPATEMYVATQTSTLRSAALRVLAIDPSGERLDLLLDALRDPSGPLRAEAAQLAGWAAVTGEAKARVRRALLAKLSDTASVVRQQAVTALGLHGPGSGTLAIARLLEDPEPTVRTAAATALGRLRDPRAIGALRRAIEGQNEGNVVRAMVEAMARLPTDEAADALLEYLDDPPPGVGPLTVAEAMGDRPAPEAALIDGLIERMREPAMEAACISALLWIGEPTIQPLTRARDRGLEPALAQEVTRLLDALRPLEPAAEDEAVPPDASPARWAERVRRGDTEAQLRAGLALARAAPPWLRSYAAATISRAHRPDAVRGWMLALVDARSAGMTQEDTLRATARLLAWGSDPAISASDRCLSLLALGGLDSDASRGFATRGLSALAGDPRPRVRACVAAAAVRLSALQVSAPFLIDEDPLVRATAVAAHLATQERNADLPAALSARLRQLRHADASSHVRAAATPPPHGTRLGVVTVRPDDNVQGVGVEHGTRWLGPGLPLLGTRGLRWSLGAVDSAQAGDRP